MSNAPRRPPGGREPPPTSPESGGEGDEAARDIIPLSRYRAQLSRARTRRRADEILDHPDPAALVPRLSVQELYYAIAEVGLSSGHDLLALATPAQVRGFLDLDAWERDHFVPERAAPWLDALIDLGPEVLLRAVEGGGGLDGEVVALWLARQVRVYDLEQEAPPEVPEGHFYPTPDSFFLLDVLAAGEEGKRVERFVDWLYRADLTVARRVVMAARWELQSDLEEHAYRWRSGRMADLGYVDYYEALAIYRYLDPASVTAGERSAEPSRGGEDEPGLPAQLLAQVEEGSFLGRTLARVADAEQLGRLSSSLMRLMNTVMSADRVEPSDLEAAQQAMRRAAACLGIGLEVIGHGDPGRAAAALSDVALARVFRVGWSVTVKLKLAADALCEQGFVSLGQGKEARPGLLDPPLGEVVAAARRVRPLFAPALDGKPGEPRPFETLGEVARAAAALEEAGQLAETVRRGLGIEPRLLAPEALARLRTPGEAITFSTLCATLAANLLLDRPALLVPLSLADVSRLSSTHLSDGKLRPAARLAVERGLGARLTEREVAEPPHWDRWMTGWISHLEEALRVGGQHPEAAGLLIGR